MPKDKKAGGVNTAGGAHINGDVNIDGHGSFIGRDQKSSSARKLRPEMIIPIVVALITVIGAIIVAIINLKK